MHIIRSAARAAETDSSTPSKSRYLSRTTVALNRPDAPGGSSQQSATRPSPQPKDPDAIPACSPWVTAVGGTSRASAGTE
jgi:hypothetical protein